uniref:E3 ubiquitin-protein ligase NRDP1 n=1 Tax=Glossina brevipalpis TaxID=37001 RepID=A0A1A9WWT4_9MUSC
MGYDLDRFQSEVNEELICPICSGVLQEPVQAAMCEHAFCRDCIIEWLSRQLSCPVDRNYVNASSLRAVPKILRQLLSRLSITCNNAANGCTLIVKLDALNSHLQECEYNPKRQLPCEKGCGLSVPQDELEDHNCVRELRSMLLKQQQEMSEIKAEINDKNIIVKGLKRELQLFKDFMHALTASNPSMRAIADQIHRDELIRWSSTLTRARVTRWGGMISTPEEALQTMIRLTLSESGCPLHILDNLMENCHERHWPCGLSSLVTRQNNRHIFDNYICRRVPGKQAVLVLSCDNAHVPEDVIAQPGLVIIFAHGVENF